MNYDTELHTPHGIEKVLLALLLAEMFAAIDTGAGLTDAIQGVLGNMRAFIAAELKRPMTLQEHMNFLETLKAATCSDAGTPARTAAVDAFVNAEFLDKPQTP